MHLCVEIKLRKAAAFIIIRKAIEDRPMYRVTNTSGESFSFMVLSFDPGHGQECGGTSTKDVAERRGMV
jgi:hypothetical protein